MELSRLLTRWLRSDDPGRDGGSDPEETLDTPARDRAAPGGASTDEPTGEVPWLAPYLAWLVSSLRSVRILDMTEPLPLDKLYLPVHLMTPSNDGPDIEAADSRFVDIEEQVRLDESWQKPGGRIYSGVEEALVENRRVALLGDPGAGKTTTLRFMALRLAKGESETLPPLPLVVDLHALGRSPLWSEMPAEEVIVAWLASEIERVMNVAEPDRPVARSHRSSRTVTSGVEAAEHADASLHSEIVAWIDGVLGRGEAVVLLDGLDEVTGATRGEHGPFFEVANSLALLAETYPSAYILFTCRRGHFGRYLTAPKSYRVLEAGPFEWEHVGRFVDVWFRANPETRSALRAQLERSTRIRGLASNPLLLALVCITYQRRGSLPQRRADVYKRCVDVLLAEWDAARSKDRNPRFTLEHKEDLLRRVAWTFHEAGQRYVRRDRLVGMIAGFLPMIRLQAEDAEPILDEITAHHGLLKDFGADWYGFHHFTLQEHFAMEHVTGPTRLGEALARRSRNWWREIIRLYAGKGDCTELVCRLAREREDLAQSTLFLIGECLAEGSPVAPEALANTVDELTRIARNTMRPVDLRIRAADLVSRLLTADDVRLMVRWLTDDRVPVSGRLLMARHVDHGYDPDVLDALSDLLTTSAVDIDIRQELAGTIASACGPLRLARYFRRIASEMDIVSRQRLALSMGQAALSYRDVIVETLGEDDVDPAVRQGLAIALGYSRDPETTGGLRQALDRADTPGVKAAIRVGLVLSGQQSELALLGNVVADAKLDTWIRAQATEALCHRSRASAEEYLWPVLANALEERSVRIFVASILGGVAGPQTRAKLLDMVRDETIDRFVRVAVMKGLGQSTDPDLVGPIADILGDSGIREYVRRAAADALGALGVAGAVPVLLEFLRTSGEEPKLGERILLALARTGTGDTVDAVLATLWDKEADRTIRRGLAEALRPGGENDQRVLASACEHITDTDIQASAHMLLIRFSGALGQLIFPEDVGMNAIEYSWASEGSCTNHQ